jgi:hypothetical protein
MNPSPLPLANRYARFRDEVFGGVITETALPGIEASYSELDWQSLWFAGAFGAAFTSTDGQSIAITDFGTWNSGPGPDFTGCAITVKGEILRGDIELDTDARDWEHHHHGANADYDRVVLHLVLRAPEQRFFTRTSQHREVPQVVLTPQMLASDAKPQRGLAAARLGRCSTPLATMELAKVASIIESAAQFRLEKKSARLHRLVSAQGREQAIFQALAQTLGYRNNQQPFVLLSQRLPLKRLLKQSAAEREAQLFGVSGFLEKIRLEDTEGATRGYVRQLWSEWWKQRDTCARWLEPPQLPRWNLAATRPGNHPQRRLGALAAMLSEWKKICTPLEDSTRWVKAAWCSALESLKHDFWSTHYTLTAEPAAKPLALIGETRVHEMLANVAYPLLVPERTRLWAEYLELPALLDNQKLRRATQRLFGDENPRAADFQTKLHHHQGLLQIYEDFCLEDDSACADCPFPERLKDWS